MAKLRTTIDIVSKRPMAAVQPFPMHNGRNGRSNFGSNLLVESATPNNERESVPEVDFDFHKTITPAGRRACLKAARVAFWKIPALQAAVLEQANLAASPFTPMFLGKDKAWGERALDWLYGWHKVMCIESGPYDYESYCELLISSAIVDGQIHTLLTEDSSGNPRVQFIPAHRIGQKYAGNNVAKVVYSGRSLWIDDKLIDASIPFDFAATVQWQAPVVDGVIIDAQNRPIAYRAVGEGFGSSDYQDYSARSMFPCFFPLVIGQLSGVSLLASSVFDWSDWREQKRNTNIALKAYSTKTLVETNETGEADPVKSLIMGTATYNDDGTASTLATQKLEAGTITHLKARTGSKLEAFDWKDQPGRNPQEFMEMNVRDCFKGIGWDMFFSLDPKSVGGAPMRVIVDRINRTLRKRRAVLKKNVLRVDVWALAKAIKNEDLPFNPDWYKWDYQGPPDLSADRHYDAETDKDEYEKGWISLEGLMARRNGEWRQLRDQLSEEVDDKYTRARVIATKQGVPIQEVMAHFGTVGNAYMNVGTQIPDADTKDTQPGVDSAGRPVGKEKAAAATVDVNINQRNVGTKQVKFIRDERGLATAAEIVES